MPMNCLFVRKTALILFLGLFATYLSLSPGTIAGQGYTGEEIDSGLRMLSVATAWVKGHSVPPMLWSRHGPVPVLFDLPFLKLGKRFVTPDFMLSFEPVLFTAGLLTILFLWLRRLCSPGLSLLLTLIAAFGTMLWPYAYIGLETKQSFFVLLAGYLGLAQGKIRTWARLLLFAASCALAMTMKSTGITLWPAIAYLAYVQFHEDWRARRAQIVVLLLVVVAIWSLGAWGRNYYWGPRGGGFGSFRLWLISSPLQFYTNLIGVFGSPTKGLFVYAPILLAALYAVPRAFRTNRSVAVFALLITACTLALICLLISPADEVWGLRYMHLAICPLLVCVGTALRRFQWRRDIALILLAFIGLAISFLGALYYYGELDFAAAQAGQNTIEWLTGDDSWNPIEFHARLFTVWLLDQGTAPVLWTPTHIWVWTPPAGAAPWKSVNLRDYCEPQALLIRFWRAPRNGRIPRLFILYLLALILGIGLLAWVVARTVKEHPARSVAEATPVSQQARYNFIRRF